MAQFYAWHHRIRAGGFDEPDKAGDIDAPISPGIKIPVMTLPAVSVTGQFKYGAYPPSRWLGLRV
jgi:hypothetical protein